MLTKHELTLIRVALMMRLETIQRDIEEGTGIFIEEDAAAYTEIKNLMAKVWAMEQEAE